MSKKLPKKIRKASNIQIMRKEMELLTALTFAASGKLDSTIPEAAKAIAKLHNEILKTISFFIVGVVTFLVFLLCFIKSIIIKVCNFRD